MLLETLPLDDIEENYVRQVRNVVFSKVFPSPMKTRSHLIALSEEVAGGILDLHPDACNSEFFTAFVTGNTFLSNSVPLSHRYGGHQVSIIQVYTFLIVFINNVCALSEELPRVYIFVSAAFLHTVHEVFSFALIGPLAFVTEKFTQQIDIY